MNQSSNVNSLPHLGSNTEFIKLSGKTLRLTIKDHLRDNQERGCIHQWEGKYTNGFGEIIVICMCFPVKNSEYVYKIQYINMTFSVLAVHNRLENIPGASSTEWEWLIINATLVLRSFILPVLVTCDQCSNIYEVRSYSGDTSRYVAFVNI